MEIPKSLKIAILDDYQNAAAPYFDKFKALGHDVVGFPDTLLPYNHLSTPQSTKDALQKRLEPFHVLVTTRERTPLPSALLQALPNLRLILTNGKRNAAIDMEACREQGVAILTVMARPNPNPHAVDGTTEHIIALVLALARNIASDDANVKAGGWQSASFSSALSGKTLGVVGLGRLGRTVARILHVAFGMKVIAWSQNLTQDKADEQAVQAGLPAETDGEKTFRAVRKGELFAEADVVSVHLVLSERTAGIITGADLGRMKPSAFFVNTARGPLVVERDLLDVLLRGGIRGAALDVFELEPLPGDSEWRSTEWGKNGSSHVLLTPHTGYVDQETITGWYEDQGQLLEEWITSGTLRNRLA
ncbi:D-3-phosphoglycerate dehydrogenase [Escovopsis weberi]|uniref:D-3-phosphoglycerate dehydrogenase n=1 Tax=Escovopsis weberi TaxID=150374 RepID=A0A0M8N1S7_ESCWE|nr:D-3-phosphoglycerate dehydrogenase [Escovopsis weberi]